jgi:hypothetical protein
VTDTEARTPDELREGEDHLHNWLLNRSQEIALGPGKGRCCGTPEWRGGLCQYHEGFSDGIYAALEAEAES